MLLLTRFPFNRIVALCRRISLAVGDSGWPLVAGLLIASAAVLHIFWLADSCPLDLAPDEAHYWDWSRHLDWSYYSKGPLVAWLIRLSCEVFGGLSVAWTGNLGLAVRLPAVACGSLLVVSLYVLTRRIFGSDRLAVGVVALVLTVPPIAVLSSLMTIDAPYVCCWGWALVFGHRAVVGGAKWAWPVAGLLVGLGILAKYTMIVWIPSLALFLLTSPEHRRLLFGRGFAAMCLVTGLCCLPILAWNAAHDWVSVKHVSGLAGLRSAVPAWHWEGPLVYTGTQFGLLFGFWFVAWAAALVAHRPWREPDAGLRYLWWMSAPMFGLFLAFSVKTAGGEPNWPVTAYVSGVVLAVGWLSRRLQTHPSPAIRRWTGFSLAAACAVGLCVTVLVHHSEAIHPALARLGRALQPHNSCPLRVADPTCRLRGWRNLATAVDRLRSQLRAEGAEPILAASGWSLPGELGFYCEGHPTAYSLGLHSGDRRSQYDLWRPNPDADSEQFVGRTFLVVGGMSTTVREAFDRVEQPAEIVYWSGKEEVGEWRVYICRGFRGFSRGGIAPDKY